MTPALQEMLDAAFGRAAEYLQMKNLAAEVGRNAMENRRFDAADDAAARERVLWDNLNGALSILAIMLDGLGYDMRPAYPDGLTPCPFKAGAELERWIERRSAAQRKS